MKQPKLIVVTLWLLLSLTIYGQKYQPTWKSIDSRPIPAWFEDAKFGIFIHWGIYSVPAYSPTARDKVGIYDRYSEHYWRRWIEPGSTQKYFIEFHDRVYGANFKYQDFLQDFKAEMFDPKQWASIFKEAGAKYVVLTSKHHEGFTLWPSQLAWNWNSVDVGPHRDLLGDLTRAVRVSNIRMGYYYSLLEWYHPLYKNETLEQYVDQHMFPQMKELIETYQPDIFWTDGEWDYTSDQFKSTDFLQWLYNDSPVKEKVVINDRWGKETRGKHGGFYTTEYDQVHAGDSKNMDFSRPWEECRGIGGSFGYNRNEMLEDYETSESLIHILIDKVSRGGNLLLNIGPTADGRIPVIMQQRLKDIGDWLKINGEAIYETRRWERRTAKQSANVFFTTKGKDLYVVLTKWQDQPLVIEGIRNVSSVQLLGSDEHVGSSIQEGVLTIQPPVITPAKMPCSYAWVYKVQEAL